jgi:hypothetical protein
MLNFSFIDDIKRWSRGRSTSAPSADADSLDVFGSEQEESPTYEAASARSGWLNSSWQARLGDPRTRVGVLVTVAIIVAGGLTGYLLQKWPMSRVQAASGSVTIESDPAGADVVSSGRSRGTTPLTVAVAPGDYIFDVVHNGRSRPLKVTVTAGGSAVHYVHFDPATPPGNAATTGSAAIPAAPAAKPAAKPATPAGPTAGWLTVNSSIPLEILEGTSIVGTSQAAKIMLPIGRHELRFTNASFGFSDRKVVDVRPGATAAVRVDLPNAPLSINAQPWAEVWVDGNRVGETPIGNHQVRIGSHEIILRHPDLGERRQNVTVTLTTPARVSVDMRKQ